MGFAHPARVPPTAHRRTHVEQVRVRANPNPNANPNQVLAWNPALDRTTKTLQRLLCHPQLVLIVDDSPAAWSQHLPNLLLIDRFTVSARVRVRVLVRVRVRVRP